MLSPIGAYDAGFPMQVSCFIEVKIEDAGDLGQQLIGQLAACHDPFVVKIVLPEKFQHGLTIFSQESMALLPGAQIVEFLLKFGIDVFLCRPIKRGNFESRVGG